MLYDSHNHLQDEKLRSLVSELPALLRQEQIGGIVVNGTREEDWPAVRALALKCPNVLPSFGLHPWYVKERSSAWHDHLRSQLDQGAVGVGEIGLDRWIEGYDLPDQEHVFTAQMELAAARNLPASIHCLRAWGRLFDLLRQGPRPERGFLLHSYGGPLEMVRPLAALGGFFSISGHFAHPRKERQREAFRAVPLDRLLVETDAPDMIPPERWVRHHVPRTAGMDVNHPANLRGVYEFAAELRGQALEEFCAQVERNFLRLFG